MKSRAIFSIILTGFILFMACGNNDEADMTNQKNSAEQKSTFEHLLASERNSNATPAKNVHGEVTWYNEWDAGMEAAQKAHKPVLIDFFAEWCKWCTVMDEKTFSAPEIQKRFKDSWITIRIDTDERNSSCTFYVDESEKKLLSYIKGEKGNFEEKTVSNNELLSVFGARGLPTFLFIDKEGKPLQKISSYIEKEEFAVILDFFEAEAYDTMSFEDFKKTNAGEGI